MNDLPVQYVSDENGAVTSVLVPISLWREITAEIETEHLLSSVPMRRRLRKARARTGGASWEDALRTLGVEEDETE